MKTESQVIRERNERILPQIEEIEAFSKIKLMGEILRRDALMKELTDAFGKMREADVENIARFIYNDIRSCVNGLVVFIDGGSTPLQRFHNHKNYRDLMAKHVAYYIIITELFSDRIANLANMLRDVDFDTVVTSGIAFDSRDMHERLSIPHILIIKDVNPDVVNGVVTFAQKDDKGQYSENVSNRERLTVFFDRLLGERMAAGKVTIFTLLDSYQNVKLLERRLGTRLNEYMSRLGEMANGFEERALNVYKCCRISLVTNAMASSDLKYKNDAPITRIQKSIKSLGVECPDLLDLFEEMKRACDSLGRDYDDVFGNLDVSFGRCRVDGEDGKVACEHMIDLMRKSPKTVVLWEGKGKGKV